MHSVSFWLITVFIWPRLIVCCARPPPPKLRENYCRIEVVKSGCLFGLPCSLILKKSYWKRIEEICCPGWGSHDCKTPICYGRDGGQIGTCENGGVCTSPDSCVCPEGNLKPSCQDVDECLINNGECSHTCSNTLGSYFCECPDGYLMQSNKRSCIPMCYECFFDHKCSAPNECQCSEGYLQPLCEDNDECVFADVHRCAQICINFPGSYKCDCEDGYQLLEDGKSCDPICLFDVGEGCLNNGECILPGMCHCAPGFRPPQCTDKDECSEGNECSQTCLNTAGSFYCECYNGFLMASDNKTCQDKDECSEADLCEHKCINEIGSYHCECLLGYQIMADAVHCEDVLECSRSNGDCSTKCVETEGSYFCDCEPGYGLLEDNRSCKARCDVSWLLGECPNGGTCVSPGICSCLPGFQKPNCKNINECLLLNGGCSHICTDTEGSSYCSCPTGFLLHQQHICQDVDECLENHNCVGICVNQFGSYSCECPAGFELGEAKQLCTDIDECDSEKAACNQECINTEGSYQCECYPGFILENSHNTCTEINLCETDYGDNCWTVCTETFGGECECPQGMGLFTDNRHCVDPCWSSPCLHGGSCIPGLFESFTCDCSGTGFKGENCQEGQIFLPSSLVVSKGEPSREMAIEAYSDRETVVWAHSEADISVSPNPIRIRPPSTMANVTVISNAVGRFKIHFNISNSGSLSKTHTMSVKSTDVFVKYHLEGRTLPTGCFYLTVELNTIKHTFSSTRKWYRIKDESRVYVTEGVTHYLYNKSALPLSLDGSRVTFGTTVHVDSLLSNPASDKIFHKDSRSSNCSEIDLSSIDMADLVYSHSALNSFIAGIKHYLPFWLRISVTDASEKPFLKAKILSGKQTEREKTCNFAVTEPNVLYLVYWFTSGFIKSLYGQDFAIPSTTLDAPHCCVIDFRLSNTFVIATETEAVDMFKGIPFAEEILKSSGIKILPASMGISNGWKVEDVYRNTFDFYNGASMFIYKMPDVMRVHATIRAKKEHNSSDYGFSLETTAQLFVENEPDTLMTHLNVRELNTFISFNSLTLTLQLHLLGVGVTLPLGNVISGDRAIIASGGEGQRTKCGPKANPPGIFAFVQVNAKKIPIFGMLSDFLIAFSSEAYFFLTFDEKKDSQRGWSKKTIDDLLSVITRRTKTFIKFMNVQKRSTNNLLKRLALEEIIVTLQELQQYARNFNTSKLSTSYLADLTYNIGKRSERMVDHLSDLEDKFRLMFDPLSDQTLNMIRKFRVLVMGSVKNLWWEMFEGSQGYFPTDDVIGLKLTYSITFFGMRFTILGEFVFSSEDLMSCSDLYEYYDHIEGGNATRLSGTVKWFSPVYSSLVDKWQEILWKFFPTEPGFRVEIAFSKEAPLFTARFEVFWKVFGINLAANLFITNKEIASFVEANVWNIFRARLTLGAAIPRKISEIRIWLKGEFLPGSHNSLETSFWTALRNVVKSRTDSAIKRLNKAQNNMYKTQAKITEAQDKINNARENLDTNQLAFDKAVKNLERAKNDLEKAKEPFRSAIDSLSRQQDKVDRLCKITDCATHCRSVAEKKACSQKERSKCVQVKPCGFSLAKGGCLLKNAGCQVIRGLAYAGLALVKGAVYVPMIALDVAKVAVSAAQVIVDKSRFLLDVAKGLYSATSFALEIVKKTLTVSAKIVDYINTSFSAIFKMFDAFVANFAQQIFDIRSCGFKVELLAQDWFVIMVNCELNILDRGWKMHSFSLNFKDVLGSMLGLTKSTVDVAKSEMDNASRRRKRSISDVSDFSLVKSANSSARSINKTVHLMSESWSSRCQHYDLIYQYLNKSVDVLKRLAEEMIQKAIQIESETRLLEYEDNVNYKLSLDDLGVDENFASEEFKLTRYDIDLALAGTNLSQNEHVLATMDFARVAHEYNKEIVDSLKNETILDYWEAEMETVDIPGDCVSFQDCILWSFGEIEQLLLSVQQVLVLSLRVDFDEFKEEFVSRLMNGNDTAETIAEGQLSTTVLESLADLFCDTVPIFRKTPANTTALLGATVELQCISESRLPPVYTWFKGDIVIKAGRDQQSLILRNVTLFDEDIYKCQAGNHIANISTHAIAIEVVFPPIITAEIAHRLEILPGDNFSYIPKVTSKPVAKIHWDCCDNQTCLTFNDLPSHTQMGQFLCHYSASNLYGTIVSREILLTIRPRQPICPYVSLDLAYLVSPTLGETADNSSSNPNHLTLSQKDFQTAFREMFWERNVHIHIQEVSVNATSHLVSIRVHPVCDFSKVEYPINVSRASQTMLNQLYSLVGSVEQLVESGEHLFTKEGLSYKLNPAYFHVRQTSVSCEDGWIVKRSECVQTVPELLLPRPREFNVTHTGTAVVVNWDAPFYAKYFLEGYTLAVLSPTRAVEVIFNVSAEETSFNIPKEQCGRSCLVTLSAFTATLKSEHISVATESISENNESGSSTRLILGISLGCSIITGVLVVGTIWKCIVKKSSKVNASGPRISSITRIERIGSAKRAKRILKPNKSLRKNVLQNTWCPESIEGFDVYDVGVVTKIPRTVVPKATTSQNFGLSTFD